MNHGTLILVQGLAGSGKSYLIEMLKHDFLIEENFAWDDEIEEQNTRLLIQNLRVGKRCIVAERKYRGTKERKKFVDKVLRELNPKPDVKYICFESNLGAANHNCKYRTNKEGDEGGEAHIAQNNNDYKDYELQEGAMEVKIHRIPKKLNP